MNIYAEFKADRLRVKTGQEEIEIRVKSDFYLPISGTESFNMFHDKEVNEKLQALVDRHWNNLGFYKKFRYWFLRNRTLLILDKAVQELVTIRQVADYATLKLDSRVVYVIRKPDNFKDDKLETIENVKDSFINGRLDGETIVSKLGDVTNRQQNV